MRSINRWGHLMANTVTIAPKTGQDAYGKATYGAAVPYRCHISLARMLVRTSTGQEVESQQMIHMMTADPIQPTSQLTLSTADVGSTEEAAIHPRILTVERRNDQTGPHHVVLRL